jgi:uncharacterized repeat protein (TIGR03803 family)
MLLKRSLWKRSATLELLFIGVLLGAAWAQTEKVIYSFCAQGWPNCIDGVNPYAGVIFDQEGNMYGTTSYGGAHELGVVFKVNPKGKETVLYSFCAQTNCTDGANPQVGVIVDQKGNLYGTTLYGGLQNPDYCTPNGCGVVFKLSPEGKETVLHSFCAQSDCTDGASPGAGLVLDEKGNLYGTTYAGGEISRCKNGCGVVFKLTPKKEEETLLYGFCSQDNCSDGYQPNSGLVFDQKGGLYGTTQSGGVYGGGVVFRVTPKGRETVLYSFCAQGGNRCTDGAWPLGGLIFDQKRNLYGTTRYGGAYYQSAGVVFKLTPERKETVLHNFCRDGYPCTDGGWPSGGLVFDQRGNLYGSAAGGANEYCDGDGCGIVFKLTPEGKETALYNFCPQGYPCADGGGPGGGLVLDGKGNLYGTAGTGGAYGYGVVFKLTP